MRIVCFGDSNTYGFDPRSYLGDRYPARDRWVDCLAKQTGWEVINAGTNGAGVPRNPWALRLISEHGPVELFLVMLGTNDLLQGASAGQTAAYMEAFLNWLRPRCKSILLVAPPPMKRGVWVPSDALVEESILLVREYQALAQRLHIRFADTRGWNVQLTYDGVHFSEEGHHTFASQLKKLLEK